MKNEIPVDCIRPDWPAPANVLALTTLRAGGVSAGAYAAFNLGDHVGDAPAAVAANRAVLQTAFALPRAPAWLQQAHGTRVVNAAEVFAPIAADGSFATVPGPVCAVLTADCLPVLLCTRAGDAVAALHAGWRGLVDGVIEAGVRALARPGELLLAWLGPAIGPQRFEVGSEVRAQFCAHDAVAAAAFAPAGDGKWRADIYLLARQRLAAAGVTAVYGGGNCTVNDPQRFYSYRRDGVTGRMASLIWLVPSSQPVSARRRCMMRPR